MEIIKSKRGRPATGRAKDTSVFVRCRNEQKYKVKEMIKLLLKDFDGFRYTSGVVAEPKKVGFLAEQTVVGDMLRDKDTKIKSLHDEVGRAEETIKRLEDERVHLKAMITAGEPGQVIGGLRLENAKLKARVRDLEQTYLSS